MKFTRRQVAPALIGLTVKADQPLKGGFALESRDRGHQIRDRAPLTAAKRTIRIPAVIIGGGISGLSAAWWFRRARFADFVLLEMESETGGNARAGENEITRYPWAAHYLPLPAKDSVYVRTLCEEFGLLKDGVWDERWLCHSPQERLFIHGRWQEGIEPHIGLTKEDAAQFDRFFNRVSELRASGAFTLPMDPGLRRSKPAHLALDRLTLSDWMRKEGLYSPYLRWLVDYSTRDDYATGADAVSAWAGLHYFAARESEEHGPLTWPEGNAWLARRLTQSVSSHIRTGTMVSRVERTGSRWRVHAGDTLYETDYVIWAAPSWLARWTVSPQPRMLPMESAPWLVANLTMRRWPAEKGLPPAWDNVIYGSPALGYVVATHQSLKTHIPRTVWTYYWAMSKGAALDQRRILLGGDWRYWCERIFADLQRAHPDIRSCVERIDIFRIGHAMPRPAPGFLTHPDRLALLKPSNNLVFANTDLSGLSLFEEAQYRGIEAARAALSTLGR